MQVRNDFRDVAARTLQLKNNFETKSSIEGSAQQKLSQKIFLDSVDDLIGEAESIKLRLNNLAAKTDLTQQEKKSLALLNTIYVSTANDLEKLRSRVTGEEPVLVEEVPVVEEVVKEGAPAPALDAGEVQRSVIEAALHDGGWEKADAAYQQLLALGEQGQTTLSYMDHYNGAIVAKRLGRIEEARTRLEQALVLNDSAPEVRFLLEGLDPPTPASEGNNAALNTIIEERRKR